MRIPILAPIGLLALVLAIVHAVVSGSGFRDELTAIFALPWGRATMVDLYLGFALISGWIIYRERSLRGAAPWIVAMRFPRFRGHRDYAAPVGIAFRSSYSTGFRLPAEE